jgi:hypothetical protein
MWHVVLVGPVLPSQADLFGIPILALFAQSFRESHGDRS